jgi:maltose O-acetyltransferase
LWQRHQGILRGWLHGRRKGSVAETVTRRAILSELLDELGDGAEVMAPFQCDYGYQIRIGARTFINYGAVIGADVQIGPAVQLLTCPPPA